MRSVVTGVVILAAGAVLASGWPARAPAEPARANYYVGPEVCRDCHRKNYRTWAKSGHRTTFQRLNLQARKNPKCLACHTTGYGHPTGFKSLAETPEFAMVGCEGCHGPAGLHLELVRRETARGNPDLEGITDFRIPAPRRESCVDCHKFHRHF